MKEKLNKLKEYIKNHIVVDIITFLGIYLILSTILANNNLVLRRWVNITVFVIALIGIIAQIIRTYINNGKKVRNIIKLTCLVLCLAIVFFWKLTLTVLLMFELTFPSEKVIKTETEKYIVTQPWHHFEYHKYINWFVYSSDYELDLDIKNDENSNYISSITQNNEENKDTTVTIENDIHKDEEVELKEDDEILYNETFDDVSVVVVNRGAWSGKYIIQILKSVDNGNTWYSQIESEEGVMDVHYGSKFRFLNENLGFINDPGITSSNRINSKFLVTNNGGKTFEKAKFILDENEEIFIDDVPYIENKVLKLNVYEVEYTYNQYIQIDYVFISEDDGLTWKKFNIKK